MYLLHFCASTVFQNRETSVTSWDFIVGFTSRLRNSFNSDFQWDSCRVTLVGFSTN